MVKRKKMKQKKKFCHKCNTLQFIWKNLDGKKLCKACSLIGVIVFKPTNKKTKPIASRSPKRILEERVYNVKRKLFIELNPMCQAHIQGVCTGASSEVHHKRGRIGSDLTDETLFLALCHACHEYIENHRAFAIEQGFSIKRIN
jgi:hypothetical protein